MNGQTRQTSSVSLTYVLRPLRPGTVVIPPAKVDVGGKTIASNSLRLDVVNGSIAQSRQQQRQADPFDDDPFAAMRMMQQRMMQQQQQFRQQQNQQRQQQAAELQGMDEKEYFEKYFYPGGCRQNESLCR